MSNDETLKVFSVETESPEFVSIISHQYVAFALFKLEHEKEILSLSRRLDQLDSEAVIHIVLVDKDIEVVEQFMEEKQVGAYWSGAREMRCLICTKYIISQLPSYVIFEQGSPDHIGPLNTDLIAFLNKKLRPDEQLWDELEEGKSVEALEEEKPFEPCDPRPRQSLNPSKSWPELHNEEKFLLDLGTGVDVDWIMVEPLRMKRWSNVIKDKNKRIKKLEKELKNIQEEKKKVTQKNQEIVQAAVSNPGNHQVPGPAKALEQSGRAQQYENFWSESGIEDKEDVTVNDLWITSMNDTQKKGAPTQRAQRGRPNQFRK